MPSTRVLFVDDEASIRMTLPAILRREGFEVAAAATVPEALDLINKQTFDVLISDLNIGEPGDGFTVVSAMRRSQPNAITFILTGYPDFETALKAIRSQVDDYLIKPADVASMVNSIRDRLSNRTPSREPARTQRVSDMMRAKTESIVQLWLEAVEATPDLAKIKVSPQDRVNHLPGMISEMADRIDSPRGNPSREAIEAAVRHGEARFAQGYSIPMIVMEARLLQRVLTSTLQINLLLIDISTLIADLIQIGESLTAELEESIRSFQRQERLAA